jgi:hypothetical protein
MVHHLMTVSHKPALTLVSGARYILGDFHSRETNDGHHGENDLPQWKPGTMFHGDDVRMLEPGSRTGMLALSVSVADGWMTKPARILASMFRRPLWVVTLSGA